MKDFFASYVAEPFAMKGTQDTGEFKHLSHSSLRRVFGHSGTQGTWTIEHCKRTWTLTHSSHSDT